MRVAAAVLGVAALAATGVAKADTFDFSSSGSGVSAMGTLTATMTSQGRYNVTGITGERNSIPITALLAPGALGGNDNTLYYPANPGYLDEGGISYTADSTNYKVYYEGVYYQETDVRALASFTVTPVPAPLPGGGLLARVRSTRAARPA